MKTTQQAKERQKIILTIMAISFAVGVIAGLTVGLIVNALNTSASATNDDYEYISEAAHSADESIVTDVNPKDAIHRVSLGKFRLTAYCPCEKCCGIWAKNRPTDIDGKPIVKTASGQIAKQGYKVSSVMNIKDEESGSFKGDYELVWDEDLQDFVVRPIDNGQMYLFTQRDGDGNLVYVDADYALPADQQLLENGSLSSNGYQDSQDVQGGN